MSVEIQMPQMGESVSEGTVLEWHVSEGDAVEEGPQIQSRRSARLRHH